MNRILVDLDFNTIIGESLAQTATGESLLNKYKSFLMTNETTCSLVNNFIKEAAQHSYDNGVRYVLEQVVDYINDNKVSWQLASACESINSNNTSYNYLNRNAAKQAEKLLEMKEEDVVKYIKAGALKNVMFCEAFRSIAKSVFKNQPMIESNSEYTTIHPISLVESSADDLFFEVSGTIYKIDENKNISIADRREVSNNFINISNLLESDIVSCVEDTLFVKVGKFEYQISEANKVTKISSNEEKEMTLEQLREDNRLMVLAANPRFKTQIANTLESIAQLVEAYDNVASMDNVQIISTPHDKFIVIESGTNLYASLLASNRSPKWTVNENVMTSLDFIKSKTRVDLSECYREQVKQTISQVSESQKEEMERELKDKEFESVRDRIANLTEKYKNDPAKLAVLSKLAEDLQSC